MPRQFLPLLLAALLAAVGCRTFDDRGVLFPRLRDAADRDDDRYADRFRDRYTLPAATATNPCAPCSGGTIHPGGMTLGMPTVVGGGYAVPMTYSPGGTYPSGPTLGPPVYPSGSGQPHRPTRDDELPLPGGYSQPGAVEMGRSVAPKPPGSLPVGK
jgi:hypothetical protein